MEPNSGYKFVILDDSKIVLRQNFGAGNPVSLPSRQLLVLGALAAVICYFYLDRVWLNFAGTWWLTTPLRRCLCSSIGAWGDFSPFNLLVFAFLLAAGRLRKSRFLTRLAVVSLLSGALAGGVALAGKNLLGRPRPKTVLLQKSHDPGEFRGPFHGPEWASFPSGHTASSVGAAVPIVLAVPEIGVPIACLSACITGSRLLGLNHYPSDLAAGASLGLFFGLRCGWSLRRIRRSARLLGPAKRTARGKGVLLPAPMLSGEVI